MAAVIIVAVTESHITNTKHSKLFALLRQRFPQLVPNPQGSKGEEETTKISF